MLVARQLTPRKCRRIQKFPEILCWNLTRIRVKKFSKLQAEGVYICFDQRYVMINLTHCMESCVSRFYFTYCMFYVWKRSIWIGVFQRAYTKTKTTIWPTKYRAGAAVVSTITKRSYSLLGGVLFNYFFYYFFSLKGNISKLLHEYRDQTLDLRERQRPNERPNVNKCLNENNWQVLWTHKCLV